MVRPSVTTVPCFDLVDIRFDLSESNRELGERIQDVTGESTSRSDRNVWLSKGVVDELCRVRLR